MKTKNYLYAKNLLDSFSAATSTVPGSSTTTPGAPTPSMIIGVTPGIPGFTSANPTFSRFPPAAGGNFFKGQLILKCSFGVFISSEKPTKFFLGFVP